MKLDWMRKESNFNLGELAGASQLRAKPPAMAEAFGTVLNL